MQVVIWIIIILVAIFLIRLLRKWIKRIIFIAILLCLAFFIYGLFSPSGASRLWYNVRTFPNRVVSWVSSSKEFLDYDSYRRDISSVGVKVEDNSDSNIIAPVVDKDENKGSKIEKNNDSKKDEKDNSKTDSKKDNVEVVEVKPTKTTNSNKNNDKLFSASDVVSVISNYVKDNLDDDTDILVTIDYDDNDSPEKIVLRTQERMGNSLHYISMPNLSVKNFSKGLQHSKTSIVTVISGKEENSNDKFDSELVSSVVGKSQRVPNSDEIKTSNGLTQSEIKEAEQMFSILF